MNESNIPGELNWSTFYSIALLVSNSITIAHNMKKSEIENQ